MTRDELHAAVVEPLTGTGVAAEPGLAERIIADLDAPDQLALLEFTLTELWTSESSGSLSHDAYAELGGVDGALTRYADGVYAALDPAEQETARWLLLQLVRPAAEALAPVRTITRRADLTEDAWQLATTKLVPARLLVADRDDSGAETVELAHEALAGHWPRLREWLAEDGRFRDWRERLRAAISRWEAGDHADSLLLTKAELTAADEHLPGRRTDLSTSEGSYVDASRTHLRRAGWIRRGLFGAGAAGVAVVLVLGTLFAYQSYQTGQQRALAAARSLASQSQQAMITEPEQGIMLALAAYRTAPDSIDARRALFGAYDQVEPYDRAIYTGINVSTSLAVDADNDVAAAVSDDDKHILVWHVNAARQTTIPLPRSIATAGYVNGASDVALSPDGRRVAVEHDGIVAGFDVARKRLVWKIRAADRDSDAWLAFVPSGLELDAVLPSDRNHPERAALRRLNAATGHVDRSVPMPHRVWELATRPSADLTWYPLADGVTVLGSSNDEGLAWNTDTGQVKRGPGQVAGPDGRHILTWKTTKRTVELTLRRATDLRPLATVKATALKSSTGESGEAVADNVVLSPDGRYGALDLYDDVAIIDFGRERVVAYTHDSSSSSLSNLIGLAAVPDGAFRLTLSDTPPSSLKRKTIRPNTLSADDDVGSASVISSDGRYVAIYDDSDPGHLDLGDARNERHLARTTLPPSRQAGRRAVFSPDDRRLAVLSGDTRRVDVWDVPSLTHRTTLFLDPVPASQVVPTAGPLFVGNDGIFVVLNNGLVYRWDARTGRRSATWSLSNAVGLAPGDHLVVAPVPGTDRVAVAAGDGSDIGIWDLDLRRRVASIPYSRGAVSALAIAPDERHIAVVTGTNGTGIELLTRSGDRWSGPRPVSVPAGASVGNLDFLPHPLRLSSGSGRNVWRVHDDGTTDQIQDLSAAEDIGLPQDISDDGTMVTGEGSYNTPTIISPSPDGWRDHICSAIGHPNTVPADLRPALPPYAQTTGLCS